MYIFGSYVTLSFRSLSSGDEVTCGKVYASFLIQDYFKKFRKRKERERKSKKKDKAASLQVSCSNSIKKMFALWKFVVLSEMNHIIKYNNLQTVSQQGLRSLKDLAPEMRLALGSELDDEEGADGETTCDEVFDSEPGTPASITPASTPMPPIEMLVERTSTIFEPKPKRGNGGVITEQVTGLQEHQRPGSELEGVSVVTEQPVRSEQLSVRFVPVCLLPIK